MKSAARPTVQLTPAVLYALMTGAEPSARLPGWVELAQGASVDAAWAQHQAAIVAMAAANGFEPFWLHGRAPAGPRFRAWRQRFVKNHQY